MSFRYIRPFLIFIILISVFGCNQRNPTKLLVTDDLKYSAYYWHFNQQTDSSEFYLVHYIEIDKDGKYIVMRHDKPGGKPKYFQGILSDTIRNFIDSTFSHDSYRTDYTWKKEDGFIYDGFTYCFHYEKQDSKRKKIQFIPHYNRPPEILQLSTLIDSLIYSDGFQKTDSIDLYQYSKELEHDFLIISPPPPKLQQPPIKFKPPKYR